MEHLTDSVLFDNTYEVVEFLDDDDDPPKDEVVNQRRKPEPLKRTEWNLMPWIWIIVGVSVLIFIICSLVVLGLYYRAQHLDENETDHEMQYRRDFVRNMTLSAWNAYVKYAWANETLDPVKNTSYYQVFGNNSGRTIMAAMTTLWVMDLKQEYAHGMEWIKNELNFGKIDTEVTVFRAITEYIGSLLSCYALDSQDLTLVKIAKKIALELEEAFKTSTGIPYQNINPKTKSTSDARPYLSFFGGKHLEYVYLSDMASDLRFKNRVMKIRSILKDMNKVNGLYATSMLTSGEWGDTQATLFALGRNFYTNLIKSYLQSGGQDAQALEMFQNAIEALKTMKLLHVSDGGFDYARTYYYDVNSYYSKMEYSGCYLGAMLSLSAYGINSSMSGLDVKKRRSNRIQAIENDEWAQGITETCFKASNKTKTGLVPSTFDPDTLIGSGSYYLSPELAESNFILWRLTHNRKYREYAWQMVQAIEKHCRAESGGYSTLSDVNTLPPSFLNNQPAVFLSGTLKYLYLTFSDDSVLPLDKWVFNSVGHPLPICGKNDAYNMNFCKM